MKTDVNLLPVYNKLYALGLEDAEVEKIAKKTLEIDESSVYNYFFAANTTLVEISPRYSRYNGTNNIDLDTLYDDEGNLKDSTTLRKVLNEHMPCYGYGFSGRSSKSTIIVGLNPMNLIGQDKKMFPAGLSFLQTDSKEILVVDGVEEVKKLLKKKLLNSFFSSDYITASTNLDEADIAGFLGWIFDMKMGLAQPGKVNKIRTFAEFIFQFTEVTEKDNIRIGVAGSKYTRGYYGNNEEFVFLVVEADKPCYDYIDFDRQFYYEHDKIKGFGYDHSINIAKLPKLFILSKDVKASNNKEV